MRAWSAASRPTSRVVFLHGITSHGGWYERCAESLAAGGCEVAFLDRRGSGLNGEAMGDVDKWQTWLDDVATYLKAARQADADSPLGAPLPTILCGISWGGKLAAAVARRYPGLLAGLALVCPGLYSPYLPGFGKRLALAAPAPPRLRRRRFNVPLRYPELFTEAPCWQAFIGSDPLALRTVTWRFAREDRQLTRYAREAATFLYLPTLLMLAGQDRIVDNGRTLEYFGRVAGYQKSLVEYQGAAHTLEFEADPRRYFADLGRWVRGVACGGSG